MTPEEAYTREKLRQLERLTRMIHDYREDLNPLGMRLLRRAHNAVYVDCIDAGAGNAARAMMARIKL